MWRPDRCRDRRPLERARTDPGHRLGRTEPGREHAVAKIPVGEDPGGIAANQDRRDAVLPHHARGLLDGAVLGDPDRLPAQEVGLAILGPLRELDEVAYLRFASVYRSFDTLDDFEAEIALLRAEGEPVGLEPDTIVDTASHNK